ncbi:hypothetical protein QTP88_022067 [Uroleucon formosanum]
MFEQIYGVSYISHSIHSVIHLADDAKRYNGLNKICAFMFENHSYLHKRIKQVYEILKNLNAFKNGLDEIKKTMKKRDELMMTHIIMMNSTIVKLCSNFDMIKKKLISLLMFVVKEYICLHAGSDSYSYSHAIQKSLDLCFDKQILNLFSYHGRSKKKHSKHYKYLKSLKVPIEFNSINLQAAEALFGLVNTVQDQIKFTQVVENYLKHAKPSPLESSSAAVINI